MQEIDKMRSAMLGAGNSIQMQSMRPVRTPIAEKAIRKFYNTASVFDIIVQWQFVACASTRAALGDVPEGGQLATAFNLA